jgi:hypothetical protein
MQKLPARKFHAKPPCKECTPAEACRPRCLVCAPVFGGVPIVPAQTFRFGVFCVRKICRRTSTNIAFHAVPIRADGNVLIIRIPRSYDPPHRIIRQGSFGHARPPESMSPMSMNYARSSMPVPSSRTESETFASTASPRLPPAGATFS